jgi:hypothetical protein
VRRPSGADDEVVRTPASTYLRALLGSGATVTSFPRVGRLAIGAMVCAVPAYFAFRFLFNTDGPGAMLCMLGVVLFGAPAVVVLPALRHDPEHAGREEIVRRRLARELASGAEAGSEEPRSTWEDRPAPPRRW